ncbi:hypothetical protein AGABI1DRAFT_92492 [Agaricus bisporus var. burnettii JB137-S8]|uniref:Retrotransposon gag domain-containing protein n=1 Tax=Agaricus bisporus var. burnettii (strain JB137-S8 / ATCC MYA-4627 / FGSC 10392) TaxID=597362 RepID=K5X6Y7_AGABU|nr:uncharacterized protein AGABI1DRAFT_92492 [Agaricus bisporus var. burnettii JB137-S8]EKM78978.1 hypothetical protein AGABI1DRAFT_92492 [Agaricus bisporus var. burnettii JB137-S8]
MPVGTQTNFPPTTAPTGQIKYPEPKRFTGDREQYKYWRSQCTLYFTSNQTLFANDESKILYMLGLMDSGEAALWTTQYINSRTNRPGFINVLPTSGEQPAMGLVLPSTLEEFGTALDKTFAPPDQPAFAFQQLKSLRQNGEPIATFNPKFSIWSDRAGLSDNRALIDYYEQAIEMPIRMEIRTRLPPPDTLKEWMDLAHQIDDLLRRNQIDLGRNHINPYRNQNNYQRYRSKRKPPPRRDWNYNVPTSRYSQPQQSYHPPQPSVDPNAMDVDNIYRHYQNEWYPEDDYDDYYESEYEDEDYEQEEYEEEFDDGSDEYPTQGVDLNLVLTPLERQRFRDGKCFRCGGNHMARNCTIKPRNDTRRPFLKRRPPPRRNFRPPNTNRPNIPKPTPTTRTVNAISLGKVAANLINTIPEEHREEAKKAFMDF